MPVPMFHGLGFGMLVLAIGLGGTVLTRRRFDAEATLVQASNIGADAMTVVPVMLARILDLPDEVRARNPLPSLRVVISSGARLDPSLARRFMDAYGDVIYNGYGSSEVGIGALATPADLRDAPETVGRPVVGLCGPDSRRGRPTRRGGRHGAGLRRRRPDVRRRTPAARPKTSSTNMMDTGDMGYFDDMGRLFIVGREDDMIVSGGENVYPRAVENALAEHPEIADNAVIGVPDEDYGQRLAAFVVPRPGRRTSMRSVPRVSERQGVSLRTAPRHPARYEIPRNPAGKVLRDELTK